MDQTFRMKIASKRQITVPQDLLGLLGVREGDYIEILFDAEKGMTLSGLTLGPTSVFPAQMRTRLEHRDMEMEKGEYKEVRDLSSIRVKRDKAKSARARSARA
jgi:bifunctional DNA-binding transcriptional regulator/antitoxin component of YhaV-PrlF toxin-antitoxin module